MMSEQSQQPGKGLFRKIKRSASTVTSTANSALPTDPDTLSASKLHHSCKTLNVNGFKECYCNHDYSYLIIKGNPTQEDLINAWNEIVFEYGGMIKTENSEYIFDLQKRIAELTQHIAYVDNALILLQQRFSQSAIDELISLGYDGIYQFDDHVQYVKQLNRVRSLCKTRVMDLQDLQEEYKKYNLSSENSSSQTEEDFEEWVAQLGRFMHFRINQHETTVTEFAGIINAYIKHHKAKQPQPTDG